MLVPAHVRVTFSPGPAPGEYLAGLALVGDDDKPYIEYDPVPVVAGHTINYGPIRVETTITSTFAEQARKEPDKPKPPAPSPRPGR